MFKVYHALEYSFFKCIYKYYQNVFKNNLILRIFFVDNESYCLDYSVFGYVMFKRIAYRTNNLHVLLKK